MLVATGDVAFPGKVGCGHELIVKWSSECVAILRLGLHSDDRHGNGGLCDLLVDDIRMDRHSVIALLMGHPASNVRNALARNGRLFLTGLIERPDWSRGRNLGLDVPRQIGRLIEGGCSTPAQFREGL